MLPVYRLWSWIKKFKNNLDSSAIKMQKKHDQYPFHFYDLKINSPNCMPCMFHNFSCENFHSNQTIIPSWYFSIFSPLCLNINNNKCNNIIKNPIWSLWEWIGTNRRVILLKWRWMEHICMHSTYTQNIIVQEHIIVKKNFKLQGLLL